MAYLLEAYRFYEDGTEAGSAAVAAQDTAISRNANTAPDFLLRVRANNDGAPGFEPFVDWRLQVSKNGGAYADVTSASSDVKGFVSTNLTDGGATTERLTGGSGAFIAGEISEDGLADAFALPGGNYSELLYALSLVTADLTENDTLDFRVIRDGSTMTYSVVPSITVTSTVKPFPFYYDDLCGGLHTQAMGI